ncbi:hypothetical protein PRIPAC_82847 [Pristionchus pacificus]|uniref:Uncharacterized protein n=1 Tax=Pristionchus pacificus TaxID=54126 RepID=A0A2A6CPG5_PRIPA|nr:hypothetical protein PRIPAC_82847 [Pristionchus pacificus]|eukprot:PDM79996.1 hypothetical protein PRIPAC_32575 [Pristionchus pacificus]
MPSDPNHPRYFHKLCCGAHVRKAVRGIALASLTCLIIQTVSVAMFDEWEFFITAVTVMDFCSTAALLVGIHRENAWLVAPYLVVQLLYILAFTIEFFIDRQATSEDPDYETSIQIAHRAGTAVGIVINIYFLKVAFNFLFFLLNKTDEKTEGPYSIHCDVKSDDTKSNTTVNVDLNTISIAS